ncbi:MAG: DUF5777 family beta-barrel protein [Methanococcaceae archaeon]
MENQYYFKEVFRYARGKSILVISFIFIFFSKAECQDSDKPLSTFKGGSYENTFSTVRIGLAQSVMIVPKGEFHLVVLHRFSEISSNVNEFFGLDYASTRLGFDYGLSNWLSATIGRSMSVQTYDFALKAVILKQKNRNNPLSASWYLNFLENTSQGTAWDGHGSFGSRLSVVNQLIIARNQGIFSFQAAPMWLHSNYEVRKDGSMDIFAVDLDTRVRLTEMLGIIAEYIPIITNEEFINTNPFTLGLDINTGHHQFQLIFSNSQGTNEKTILTNNAAGHIYFGFNLTRIFNSKTD